jgi:predicted O-linked N-acetylglucosamine transferase (SPINDLY family)
VENVYKKLHDELVEWQAKASLDTYSIEPINELRPLRERCAVLILSATDSLFDGDATALLEAAHGALVSACCFDLPVSDTEQELLNAVELVVANGNDAVPIRLWLFLMLYKRPHLNPLLSSVSAIPSTRIQQIATYVFTAPSSFLFEGEPDIYRQYIHKLATEVLNGLSSIDRAAFFTQISIIFANNFSCIALYFSDSSLVEFMKIRAAIFEALIGGHVDSPGINFHPPASSRTKKRIGVLAAHFLPQTETYATLPVYRGLDRTQVEIILISVQNFGIHPLEKYCGDLADRTVSLTGNLRKDVNTIRELDLDLIWIGTNITAVLNYTTQLSVHRLARLQVTGGCSPISTGFKHIDMFCSGSDTERNGAEIDYSEKLTLFDGPAHCFDMQAVPSNDGAKLNLSRSTLNLSDSDVVYISGANYFKIVPELLAAWAKILSSVDNARLILFPFNPNWSRSYRAASFIQNINSFFSQQGLSADRVVLVKPLESRSQVLELIGVADVYLDSFPYSGMTSLLDPLEVGLPIVAAAGKYQRQRMSAAALRGLGLESWVCNTPQQYIDRAIEIGASKSLRVLLADELRRSLSCTPKFLDAKWYSNSVAALLNE